MNLTGFYITVSVLTVIMAAYIYAILFCFPGISMFAN